MGRMVAASRRHGRPHALQRSVRLFCSVFRMCRHMPLPVAATATYRIPRSSTGVVTPFSLWTSQVHDALADCLHELQGLVHTVEAKSRGEEPPIGEMLGLDRPPELGAHFVRTNDPDEQLHTVTEMRRTVSRLRQQVCNKYAGDLGPEACAMQ
jgi:hypothetical protein